MRDFTFSNFLKRSQSFSNFLKHLKLSQTCSSSTSSTSSGTLCYLLLLFIAFYICSHTHIYIYMLFIMVVLLLFATFVLLCYYFVTNIINKTPRRTVSGPLGSVSRRFEKVRGSWRRFEKDKKVGEGLRTFENF